MASVNDLKAGVTFEENNDLYEVMTYEHIKMGRGSATIKVKARNLRSGATIERGFINGEQVKIVTLDRRILQFLYKDATIAYFMDPASYEQFTIPLSSLDGHEYLQDGGEAVVRFYGEEPLALLLPPKVTLKVKDTPPGVKGNSASNMYKEATLENGVVTKVPLFINIGDSIVVDTRDGSYTKRA